LLESIEGFVQDIVKRSKDCERLIAALPQKSDSAARVSPKLMGGSQLIDR
jgi:hypothetical protein